MARAHRESNELITVQGGISTGHALNLFLPQAGGPLGAAGDYHYHDGSALHNLSGGLWAWGVRSAAGRAACDAATHTG